MKADTPTAPSTAAPTGNGLRLVVLTLVHFTVDFYGGLTVPIAEPTLTRHLGTGLGTVALLIGGSALLTNAVQPVSQWFLPRSGAPKLLVVAPLAAAGIALIGLSHSMWIVAALLLTAAVGIGIIHPEAALAAHSLAGRNKGIGLSFFMAGGYLGFSTGSLVSGLWTEFRNQGLANFWLLVLPAAVVALLVVATGLHRIRGHMDDVAPPPGQGVIPFGLVFILALCITTNLVLLVRMLPIFLVRTFPAMDAQGWAGTTVSALGLSGVAGMFLWGHLADRFGSGRVIALAAPAGLPFLWLLFHIHRIAMAPVWAVGVGLTVGSLFPLCVVLARHARGLPQRLRMGLVIGGAWGGGELAFVLSGKYVGRFPEAAIQPVATILNLCFAIAIASTLLAVFIARMERQARPDR